MWSWTNTFLRLSGWKRPKKSSFENSSNEVNWAGLMALLHDSIGGSSSSSSSSSSRSRSRSSSSSSSGSGSGSGSSGSSGSTSSTSRCGAGRILF